MPKEQIGSTDNYDAKGGTSGRPQLLLEVGWTHGNEDVQIATVNREQATGEQGWFVHLDRNRVNMLIRALRKARDQSFGVDA